MRWTIQILLVNIGRGFDIENQTYTGEFDMTEARKYGRYVFAYLWLQALFNSFSMLPFFIKQQLLVSDIENNWPQELSNTIK